jgi:16S rRNA (guanine966-N2)-methyltransferase
MNKSPPPGHVRIIAGKWRGTKLPVIDAPGLRPSSDRVRETLFNWLQPHIAGSRVLDLFAGTGALGFEAASRGASAVVMIERDAKLAQALQAGASKLSADTIHIQSVDALLWLDQTPKQLFDVVFIDPPFDKDLWHQAITKSLPHLAPSALLYVESSHAASVQLPPSCHLHREGSTRQVDYRLYRYDSA